MASELDISLQAADIYADALLDLANERGVAESLFDEFKSLVDYIESDPDFADFLANPVLDATDRRGVIQRIFTGRMSELLLNLMLVLNDHGRAGIVPLVYGRYKHRLDTQLGRQDVYLTSAAPLDDAQRAEIKATLSAMLGKQAVLVERVDAAILGGLVVKIGDRQYDGSLRRGLARLREKLTERGDREILAEAHGAG
jgi:F-type H+-transporting ATPase subunit delta